MVVAYGKILPAPVLGAFPYGCLNIHGSLLPKYRGAAPVQWAILSGDEETGVSIMRLDEGMDTGPVLLTERETIRPEDTTGLLLPRLADVGAGALLRALEAVGSGDKGTPQDDSLATVAPMLQKKDGRVDWTQPSQVVGCRIRALDPWPGSFTELDGARLKLFGAGLADASGQPGEILSIGEGGVEIGCGSGSVLVRELQAAGKKRMLAGSFLRGRRISPGARLGSEASP